MHVLKELRSRDGYSQAALAKIMNVSRSTIAMWETGASNPDGEALRRLAEIFDVSTDYLLGRIQSAGDNPAGPRKPITLYARTPPFSVDVLVGYFDRLSAKEQQDFLKTALDHIVDARDGGKQEDE